MRRLCRRAIVLISFLAFAASSVLWIRSYLHTEMWTSAPRAAPAVSLPPGSSFAWTIKGWHRSRIVMSSGGQVGLIEQIVPEHVHGDPPRAQPGYLKWAYDSRSWWNVQWGRSPLGARARERRWSVPGITYYARPAQSTAGGTLWSGTRSLAASWWLITLLTAILPGIWARAMWVRWRNGYRRRRDLCHACGYDLRATPDRCPECGNARSSAGQAFLAADASRA